METLRQDLHELLGGWPQPRACAVTDALPDGESLGTATLHRLSITPTRCTERDDDASLPSLLLRPAGPGPFPAVLYCHAHGNDYAIGKRELLDGRGALRAGPWGPALAQRGILALCIDLPGFGERTSLRESALAKRYLWHRDTLFGAMLRELAAALDWLGERADVDATRIATLGLSMGSTTAWWLAALDTRIAAVVELCCLADMRRLVALQAHDLHGIYLTVPGLLARCDTADIAGLICPRPHFVGIGDQDPLTPPDAVDAVLDPLRKRYSAAGVDDALAVFRSANTGHEETPAMRRAALDFLTRQLLAPRDSDQSV